MKKKTALFTKLQNDLLNPRGTLGEVIDSLDLSSVPEVLGDDALSTLTETYKEIIPEPISSGVVMKNNDKALEYKKKGNGLFKEGKLQEAREAYTQALRLCPVNEKSPMDNKDYAIILANRSAASEGLGIHQGVVLDVDLALKYGYPREMHYKVLNRKAQAYKKLRQFFSSKQTYKKCLDMIGKSDMPTKMRDQWRTRTQKQINLFGIKKDAQPAKETDHPFDSLTQGHSSEVSEMSSKLSLKEDKILSTEEIQREDRLFMESPLVTVLSDPKSYGKLCPYTLQRMPAPIPCNFGSSENFYDEESRSRAIDAFHKYEWPIIKDLKDNLSPLSRLSLRLILRQSILDTTFLTEMKGVISKEEALLCSLVGIYLGKALAKVKFPEAVSYQDCAKALLYTYKNRLPINMLLKEEERAKLLEEKSYPRQEYALGIYPRFSSLNNEKCKPGHSNDVFPYFLGSKLLLCANRRIPSGEKVTFKSMANLSGMQDVVLFKCEGSPECRLSFPLKENTSEQVIICPLPECGIDTNIWRLLKRLHELKREARVGREIFLGSKKPESLREALAKYQDVIDEFEGFIERPYRFITEMEGEMRIFMEMDLLAKEEAWTSRSDTEFKNDLFA